MRKTIATAGFLGLFVFALCRSGAAGNESGGAPGAAGDPGLAASALDPGPPAKDTGIGPVKNLTLGPMDTAMADRGKNLYDNHCVVCHGLTEAKTGPALGDVLARVTPEFFMNLLLNTAEMEKKNARIAGLIKKYGVSMPPPELDNDQARSVLEYLRTTKKGPRP